MAESKEKKEKQEKPGDKQKTEDKSKQKDSGAKIGLVTWAIMGVVVLVLAGSGLILGQVVAGMTKTSSDSQASEQQEKAQEQEEPDSYTDDGETWYYNGLQSIVVNPDEPGAMRYVRIGLTLEISSEIDEVEAEMFFIKKNPALISWLNIYLKSLTLDEMENDRDINRILSDVHEAFNEILFPNAKPKLKKVLIREFNIQ